jgi:microsomal dipeptidase-like Zn-dependent dipeptidase
MRLTDRSAFLAFFICASVPGLACTGDDDSTPAATEGESNTGDTREPLEGVADLHLHMFAEEAFGGGWLHGTVSGPGETALGPCDGGEPGDHGRLKEDLAPLLASCNVDLDQLGDQVPLVDVVVQLGGNAIGEFVGAIPGTDGDTGRHTDRTDGFPDFTGWPRWDAIAHQQVWEEHLEQAWEDGLRLEIVSAVSFDFLCRALPEENLTRPQCDEMADVRLQLQMAGEFAATHDWVEIALSAADARRIIGEGKLAFVLSVEASHIMQGPGDWRPMLDELYGLGVRTLQPVHQVDNRFAGAAPHNEIFQIAEFAENCHVDTDCGLTNPGITLGFDVDAECRNVKGLTDEGKALIQEMIDRGMLLDAAHMSEHSVRDLNDIAVANDYYPFYLSHGHFREIMLPEKAVEEKTTPSWVIAMIRESGGMFGLRTAPDEVNDYSPSPIANTCHGSSRSFAQAYDYGRMGLKVDMGLGSDLNGFIQQTRPRFGPDACSGSFTEEQVCQSEAEMTSSAPRLGTDFDEAGLGHMGVAVDLVDDLEALGDDVQPLRRSADTFVRMWERAEGERDGPAQDISDLDTTGVVIQPNHSTRRAQGC